MPYKILMVDDELRNIKAIRGFLTINGYEVTAVSTGDAALSITKKEEFALALLDFRMPDMNGGMLASMIRKISPFQQVAMFSCDLSREALKQSYGVGAVDFIEKDELPEEILKRVRTCCERYEEALKTVRPSKNSTENRDLIESVGMIGQSTTMATIANLIKKFAAEGNASVLIRGESGTGKELVAKALHELSPRSAGPFIAINCAAIPKDLLESTLFGHKQGAFTGAVANQDGKFIQAHGGTLFLDEIGDLPLDLQSKLLRVLQERVVEPVGGRVPRKIDVRILSATHKDLDTQIKSGLFREDLKYRIKVVEIHLPPLRERPEDIELLILHFTKLYNETHSRKKHFQYKTLDSFKKYPWPGNVRELASIVQSHLIQASDSLVKLEDLKLDFCVASNNREGLTLSELDQLHGDEKLSLILSTIETTGGRKIDAARRLGIKPTHLQYLLKQSKAAKKSRATKQIY